MEQAAETRRKAISQNKVIIVNPVCFPGIRQPGMMAYNGLTIAIPLKRAGFDVKFVDLHWSDDPERDIIVEAEDALVVGFSAMTGHQIKDGLAWAGRLRELRPDLPLAWGGPHVSLFPRQTLEDPRVDFIVKGQGTFTFTELAERLRAGEPTRDVAGIGWKRGGVTTINPDRPFRAIDDFRGYPFELLDVAKIGRGAGRMVYNSSEGCPWRCSFCANQIMYDRRWVGLDVAPVVEDLRSLVQRSGTRHVDMLDTNFFVDKRRVLAFSDHLCRSGLDMTWGASCRSDQILKYAPDELKILSRGGLRNLLIGMESGSQRMLDLMLKDCPVEMYLQGIEHAASVGIHTVGLFMMGIPTETAEDRNLTRTLIREVNAHPNASVIISVFTPYPGESLFDLCVKEGFVPPTTFEEWGEFSQDKVNVPWLDRDFKWDYDGLIAELRIAKSGVEDDRVSRRLGELHAAGYKQVLLWGAGLTAAIAIAQADRAGINVVGIADNNPDKWGRRWYGKEIFAPREVPWSSIDSVLIASAGYEGEIFHQISEEFDLSCPVWTLDRGRMEIDPLGTTLCPLLHLSSSHPAPSSVFK